MANWTNCTHLQNIHKRRYFNRYSILFFGEKTHRVVSPRLREGRRRLRNCRLRARFDGQSLMNDLSTKKPPPFGFFRSSVNFAWAFIYHTTKKPITYDRLRNLPYIYFLYRWKSYHDLITNYRVLLYYTRLYFLGKIPTILLPLPLVPVLRLPRPVHIFTYYKTQVRM